MAAFVNTQRGSALLEFCVTAPVFVLIIGLTFVGGYLVLARAWLDYQTEQALYCAAEGRSPTTCARELRQRVADKLFFGRTTAVHVTRRGEHWGVDVCWKIHSHAYLGVRPAHVRIKKTLSLARVLGSGARSPIPSSR